MKKFLISNSSYQLTDHICLAYITILINNFPHNNKKEGMCEKEGMYEKDIYECIYRPHLHWQRLFPNTVQVLKNSSAHSLW